MTAALWLEWTGPLAVHVLGMEGLCQERTCPLHVCAYQRTQVCVVCVCIEENAFCQHHARQLQVHSCTNVCRRGEEEGVGVSGAGGMWGADQNPAPQLSFDNPQLVHDRARITFLLFYGTQTHELGLWLCCCRSQRE